MVRAYILVAVFCLVQALCFAQDNDHESHENPEHHWNKKHHEHHGEHGWMKPKHGDEWADQLMNIDWSKFFDKINLHELLENEDIQKMWEAKDWERLVKKVMVFMHSKDAWREADHEYKRHMDSRRKCKLAAIIAGPIIGVIVLALLALCIVKCIKKKNKGGQKGRIVYPSAAAAAPMPYFVGTDEKKLKPEEAFGPAFGPGLDSPPPAYPAETEKPTAPEA